MADFLTLWKFPEGSANRHYFLFEKTPEGLAIWRDLVVGMEKAELRLQELARESNNKFFALNLRGSDPAVHPNRATNNFSSEDL
jgi:hypothetical protein